MRNKHYVILLILVLLHLMMLTPKVLAQDEEDYTAPGPISGIDLGVSSLQLSVGESYSFNVSFEPADTKLTTLDWYVTDESVITIDPLTDTVTAVGEGEARIFAESFDQFAYAVCDVIVGDPVSKSVSVTKSGSAFMDLSPEDLGKISAETLTHYLDFVADSVLDERSYENASSRTFDVIAAVKPGTEKEQSALAKECGIEDSEPLEELNAVTLYGSLDAILRYVKDNSDLREIFEFGPFVIEEPEMDEVSSESIQKAVGLQGYTQELTNISYAHKMGLKGKGRWIAVIDSGIRRNNAQFTNGGRTIIEACFSKTKTGKYYSVCTDGSQGAGASEPRLAIKKSEFNHGSHVSGIAAGRDGIAPLANLISIQSHTEKRWTCKASERKDYACRTNSNQCCKSHISNGDLGRAYEYILKLAKTRKIDAVNMSYGRGTKNKTTCDSKNKWEKNYFDKFRSAGILPVLSAGNSGYDGAVGDAACLSNAYVVANITMRENKPMLAKSSNFSKKIDIAAPGSRVWSAGYSPKSMMYMSGTSMAAPMVSGAVALVKQMYPGMTPDDVGEYLKTISQKTVNKRIKTNWHFTYSKPVLTFGAIHKLTVPYYNWITGGDKSITFKVYRMAMNNAKFSADVTTFSGQKIPGIKVSWKSQGDFTYVRISGNALQNGQIYKVALKRTFKIGSTNYWSTTTEYGRPISTGTVKAPTANPLDKSVSLTAGTGGARYYIYDAATGNLVRQMNVTNAAASTTIKGLVNGRVYAVTASPYRQINITKNGTKRAVNFYGTESGRVLFMPMSSPFNLKVGYPINNKNQSKISCSADNAATGIMVTYRKSGTTGGWTQGCKSENGKFSCTVNVGRGYDFRVQKYKTLNGKTYYGPFTGIPGRN